MADRPNPTKPKSTGRRALRRVLTSAVLACTALGSGGGCSIVSGLSNSVVHSDCIDEFMVGYRNSAWSAKSWHANKHRFCNQAHNRDFMAGYRAGYEDVASGGNGCTPALPPREYWGWRYQSPEGQAKVAAWFAGYPHGAAAAERDGLKHWSELRTMTPPEATMPAAGALPGPIPSGGAPTPIEGMSVELGDGESILSAEDVTANYGDFDFSSVPRVSADSVPTAATGR